MAAKTNVILSDGLAEADRNCLAGVEPQTEEDTPRPARHTEPQ